MFASFRTVLAVGLLGLIACSAPQPSKSPSENRLPERSSLLLITIDTLRADHLSAYGYPRETSPFLDRLGAEGVRFERAIAQWPKTGPSFASMFSSTYPKDNGIVRRIGIPVPETMTLLAEPLLDAGYETGAVVANGALSSEFGFDQGFEHYIESWQNPPADAAADGSDPDGPNSDSHVPLDPDGAERVADLALDLAARLEADERPFFLWVHFLDPHFPYRPPEPFSERFQDDEHHDPDALIDIDTRTRSKQMLGIGYRQVLDGRRDLSFYVARYDAEIAYVDSEIERLVDGLGENGLLDQTLIAVTSDHGESLGEHHYYFDHGRFAFQASLRVPLLLHYPGVVPPGVVEEPVELIDLAPTLLQFAGLEIDGERWQAGRSLLPRLLGQEPESTPAVAFSEAGYAERARWQRAVQDGRFKLVVAPHPKARRWYPGEGQFVLYDLDQDPGETADVSAAFPDDRQRLRGELTAWLRAAGPTERAPTAEEAMNEETREQLRALGYLD